MNGLQIEIKHMKIKFNPFSFILLVLILVGCSKNLEQLRDYERFQADFGDSFPQTKTFLQEKQLFWAQGDSISINGCVYLAEQSGAKTTFSPLSSQAQGDLYSALYPASIYKAGKFVLPRVQTFQKGSLRVFPMYAESSSKSLSFVNICGLLAIKVNGDDNEVVKQIEVSADDAAMCGEFTVVGNAAVLTEQAENEKRSVILDCGSGVALSDNSLFYVAIPPGSYSGLTVRATVSNGTYTRTFILEAVKKATVARNVIYNIGYSTTSTNKEIVLGNSYKLTVIDDYLIGLGTLTSSSVTSVGEDQLYSILGNGTLCSSGCNITSDGQTLVGRNFDLQMSYKPIYVFKTSFGKYRTFNIAYTNSILSSNFSTVKKNGSISVILRSSLPYISGDVLNEKGLYVSMNMRVSETQFKSSGTKSGKTANDVLKLPQMLCMNCATVDEAIQYAQNEVSFKTVSYHLGFMIADATGKHGILEIVSNRVAFTEDNAHSNFWVDPESKSKEKYPEGLGRYQVWKDNVGNAQTEKQMFEIIAQTHYSHFYYDIYKDSSQWHYDIRSDFTEWVMSSYDTAWLTDDNNFSSVISMMKNKVTDYRGKTEDQLRSDGQYWMSCFSTVTNCTRNKVTVQLWEKPECRYVFKWDDN